MATYSHTTPASRGARTHSRTPAVTRWPAAVFGAATLLLALAAGGWKTELGHDRALALIAWAVPCGFLTLAFLLWPARTQPQAADDDYTWLTEPYRVLGRRDAGVVPGEVLGEIPRQPEPQALAAAPSVAALPAGSGTSG